MANFSIILKGVGIFYDKKDGACRVLFPIDDCHSVKYFWIDKSDPTKNGTIISFADESPSLRRVEILTTNATPPKTTVTKKAESEFLDMSQMNLHTDGLMMEAGWKKNSLLLKIENGCLDTHDSTPVPIRIVRNGDIVIPGALIGNSAIVDVVADRIKVVASGFPDIYRQEFDTDAIIVIDNDCGDVRASMNAESTDLGMLYACMEDRRLNGYEFEAQPSTGPSPGKLPCHLVRSDDPDGLPG